MRILLLLALLSSPLGAASLEGFRSAPLLSQSQPTPLTPYGKIAAVTPSQWARTGFIAARSADIYWTWRAMREGGTEEWNPLLTLFGDDPEEVLISNIALTVIGGYAIERWMDRRDRRHGHTRGKFPDSYRQGVWLSTIPFAFTGAGYNFKEWRSAVRERNNPGAIR